MMNPAFTVFPLVLLAGLLVLAAAIDWRTFKISNRLNLAVAALAPVYWWTSGLPLWPEAAIQFAVALTVFALLAAAFYAGMMGGGDVKLATAIALWFPPLLTAKFLVWMSLAGGLLTVALVISHKVRRRSDRPRVPYGVAIAAGGLLVLAERFLNHFA